MDSVDYVCCTLTMAQTLSNHMPPPNLTMRIDKSRRAMLSLHSVHLTCSTDSLAALSVKRSCAGISMKKHGEPCSLSIQLTSHGSADSLAALSVEVCVRLSCSLSIQLTSPGSAGSLAALSVEHGKSTDSHALSPINSPHLGPQAAVRRWRDMLSLHSIRLTCVRKQPCGACYRVLVCWDFPEKARTTML